MRNIVLIGMPGCGKSTVTAVFAARDIPLADADQLSREILLPGSPLLPQLAECFGADVIKEDGTLDRRLLADRAFATPEGKAALDALGEITGETMSEKVIDEVFAKFCVGK